MKNLINESENPAQQLAQLRQRVAELEAALAVEQMMRQRVETALRDREAYKSYQVILDDALRPLADPGEIQLAACRVLAEHIGASQVLYADVIDEKQIAVRRGSIDGAPLNLDAVPGNELNDIALEEYKAGKFLVINDINSTPRLTETERRVFKSLGVAAHLSRGLIKEGRWIAALGVNSSAPRVWTQVELDLVDETIQRTWAAVAEARAEEEARKVRDYLEEKVAERTAEFSRERQRLFDVLETLPANICLISPDYRIPFANRAFRQRFGETDGRHCYDYIYGLNKPCEGCRSLSPLVTGEPIHWTLTAPDGAIIDAYDFPFIDIDGATMIL